MNITFSLILLAVSSAAFAWFAYRNRKSSVWTLRIVSGVVWLVLFVAIDLLASFSDPAHSCSAIDRIDRYQAKREQSRAQCVPHKRRKLQHLARVIEQRLIDLAET
jgi:hypothetical protein